MPLDSMKYEERLPVKTESSTESSEDEIYFKVNSNLKCFDDDYMYHISLGKSTHNLKEMFGDVKFICMGGTQKRMLKFAYYVRSHVLGDNSIEELKNLSEASDRYSMYKVGPVLSVSHGIGCPSISILIHELIKLIHYAECKNVKFFRIGTCGGIGVTQGSIVVTDEAVDGMFRPEYRQIVLGRETVRTTKCDVQLVDELMSIGREIQAVENTKLQAEGHGNDDLPLYNILTGKTMCCHDFYEGQARIDGALCNYTLKDKFDFLLKCKEHGIKNLEMESLCFASLLSSAGLSGAVVCVTLLDRLRGDQVVMTPEQSAEFQERPFKLVGEYIRRHK